MKPTIIAFSLVANLFLAGLLFFPTSRDAVVRAVRRDAAPAGNPASVTTKPSSAIAGAGNASGVATGIRWEEIKAGDYREAVRQAQASGMAPAMIRALLQARFQDEYSARRRELVGNPTQVPYWRTQVTVTDPKVTAELRRMSNDFSRTMTELLGPDTSPYSEASERLQFGGLSSDKVAALRSINSDYQEMMAAIRQGVVLLPSDRTKLLFLEEQKDADIRAALTPAEYEDYQLRASTTANSMRNNLVYFEPTEAEFRSIFALQQAFDRKYNSSIGLGAMSPEQSRQRSADQQALVQEIKAVLPPERVADYERATDGNYRSAMQVVQQLQLPPQNGMAVWQAQKDIQSRAQAVRQDRTLSQAAQFEKLAALQSEANNAIGAALGGPRGLEAYKQYTGGWIDNLVPASARPPVIPDRPL